MTATPALTADLKAQVKLLADDLRKRLDADPDRLADWKRTHQEAVTKDRTAMTWVDWREDRIDQAAVAWVLTTVFIRFCEDNSLVKPVWFSGPLNRRQEAFDGYNAYFRANPEHSDREWLESGIAYLRGLPATKALVDAHSALEYVAPSGDGVGKLREFWLRRDNDGALIHDLHDASLSTRFLGDLYQDLSDYAKDKYALLQTPVFVEEFILDRTLEPSLAERPLEGFRMIDPTCGSGHFLLGAFARLLDRWHKHAPGMETQARVQTALDAIHGVDLNPFAVAIARFRLTVAALAACELRALEGAPAFKFHLAVGDSLIHGPDANVIPGLEARSAFMAFHYATEDASQLLEILEEGRYDTVVGNPPYIQPQDKSLSKVYRAKFGNLCRGTYALTVPFMAEFFSLAKRGERAGWVGAITSNSFMKREFGINLIEKFLPRIDLRLIIDSEGAWIPGHNSDGTPTVIMVGKMQSPVAATIRVVLSRGKRETRAHGDQGNGPYWSSLAGHWDQAGWANDWISVLDMDRNSLSIHPWSLAGGEAADLLSAMSAGSENLLKDFAARIGFFGDSHADEAFFLSESFLVRLETSAMYARPAVRGGEVRNWIPFSGGQALFPYDQEKKLVALEDLGQGVSRYLWTLRSSLGNRSTFGGATYFADKRPWYEWHQLPKDRNAHKWAVVFAEIASHGHFAIDTNGTVFNRTAPVIKLKATATAEDHLRVVGALNSAVGCFWLRQMCKPKGGAAGQLWSRTYQFNGKTLSDFPLPRIFHTETARILTELALDLAANDPRVALVHELPSSTFLDELRGSSADVLGRMISVQEELDWEMYRNYGLVGDGLSYKNGKSPPLAPGERAFEIAMARNSEYDEREETWFADHRTTPIF